MTEIIMDGEPLKVGDEVYSLSFGKGKVYEIRTSSCETYPIRVLFSVTNHSFNLDFANLSINKKTRDLYWQKPEIIPPPKPRKKVTVYDWYIEWKIDKMHKNGINRVYGLTEDEVRTRYPNDLIQKIDGTEREVEK